MEKKKEETQNFAPQQGNNVIAMFKGNTIRRAWDKKKEKWYFSVIDVVRVLTGSNEPRRYWSDLKKKLKEEGSEVYENIVHLKLIAPDGKKRETDCFSTEALFRLIQSIPSPKAEPFKLWLAKVGYERVQEIENPELAQERMKKIYEQKGYSKQWIEKRLRGIVIRQDLTDEWKERGIHDAKGFAILTSEISKASFDMTPKQYKKHKKLKRENLRDHMTDLELIFSMLGEKVTTEISKNEKPKTFTKNKRVAKRGGTVAGNARKETEKEIGKSVISNGNYLTEPESKKRLKER